MGAFSPAAELPGEDDCHLSPIVLQPIVEEMGRRGTPYHGVLYAGVMLTAKGLRVLEYNVRFGDPEAQALLPRLESDLLSVLFRASRTGGLSATEHDDEEPCSFRWSRRSAVTVTLASAGYPGLLLQRRPDRGTGARARGRRGDPRGNGTARR